VWCLSAKRQISAPNARGLVKKGSFIAASVKGRVFYEILIRRTGNGN
jgi:hypothetical protein